MFDIIWIISDVILIILHFIFAIFDVTSVFLGVFNNMLGGLEIAPR